MKNPLIRTVIKADPDTEAEVKRLRERVRELESELGIMATALKRAMPADHFQFDTEADAIVFARENGTTYRPVPGKVAFAVPCTVALARKYPTARLIAL